VAGGAGECRLTTAPRGGIRSRSSMRFRSLHRARSRVTALRPRGSINELERTIVGGVKDPYAAAAHHPCSPGLYP